MGWGDRPLVVCLPKERVYRYKDPDAGWVGQPETLFCVCLGIFTLNHSNSSADARFNADCIQRFKLGRVLESVHTYHSSIREVGTGSSGVQGHSSYVVSTGHTRMTETLFQKLNKQQSN